MKILLMIFWKVSRFSFPPAPFFSSPAGDLKISLTLKHLNSLEPLTPETPLSPSPVLLLIEEINAEYSAASDKPDPRGRGAAVGSNGVVSPLR